MTFSLVLEKIKTMEAALSEAGFKPASSTIERGGAHTPSDPESGAPAWGLNTNGIYPDDVYSFNALRYYGTGEERMDREAVGILSRLAGRADRQVRIYRAVEKDSLAKGIQPGDWVTIVKGYAVDHGKATLGGKYKIQEKLVMAGEVFTSGDSWLEWGYHPQDHGVLVKATSKAKKSGEAGITFSLVYHETNPERALLLIDENTRADMTLREIYFADRPEMATGQGENKGVRLEFDREALDLKPNRSKPGLAYLQASGQGAGEFIGVNQSEAYRAALKAVEWEPAKLRKMRGPYPVRFAGVMRRLEGEGWVKRVTGEVTRLERPASGRAVPADASNVVEENGKPVGGGGGGVTFSLKPVDEFMQGSVVVNADGTPKEVYHGTPDVRGILKEGFAPSFRGEVFFFTDQKAVAETYADDRRAFDYQAAEPHVVSVFLSLKNPLRVDAKGARWRDTEKYIEEARAAGHDGIEIRNTRDEYNDMGRGRMSTVYAVFSPAQIRSSAKSPYFSRVDRQSLGMPQTFSLAQTDTAAFKAWFGASKVVDADGKPLVVYHGTGAKFTEFKADKPAWFTDTYEAADEQRRGPNGSTMEVFLKMENPLEFTGRDADGVRELIKWLREEKEDPEYADMIEGKLDKAIDWDDPDGQTLRVYLPQLFRSIQKSGYDGVIFEDWGMQNYDDYFTSYIPFSPTQIKSATGNRGTFDRANPDITMSLAPAGPARPTMRGQAPAVAATRQGMLFAATGIPQNQTQAMQQQGARFAAQQAATFPYPYHRISSAPTQAKVSLGGHEAGLMGRVLLPVSERLRFIADKAGSRTGILYRARRYYSEKGTNLKRYSDEVVPLMRGLAKMSTQDMKVFKAAASNQDALARNQVIAKYGLQNEWAAYEAARDSLRAEMIAAGIEVGDIGEYFPRWVKDVTGLRASFGRAASDGPLEQAMIDAEKAAGRALTDEEVNAVLDGAVRGVNYGVKGGAAPSNTKQRKIVTIADTQLDFYADPNHALSRWLSQSTEAIARYRFFGKATQPSTTFPSQIDLDVSIGAILREEVETGNLDAKAQMEVKAMLDGLFAYHGRTNAWIRGFMDLSYWATMGKLSSALAQVTDVMVSVYEAGPWNTGMAFTEAMWRNAKNLPGIGNSKTLSEAVANFTKGKDWLTREELGIDRIMAEFDDQRFTTRALNQVFTATGLNYMDGLGKDTLLNAKFRQLAKQAKRSAGLSASNQKMIEQVFGKAKAGQVIADFRTGTKNADTVFAVYNVLADWQPISLLEYPEAYAKNPNARVLYMLKSYSIKMLAAYRREGFMKMWYGSPAEKVEGARNLAYLLAMLFMAGVSKDWLVDFMLDRDPQLEDVVLDNVFKLAQVSRYALWEQRNRASEMGVYGGVDAAARMAQNTRQILTDIIAPPTVLIERPAKDVAAWAKAQADYEPWSFWESESVQFIPVAGEFIYWTGPTGQAKIERRRKLREE
jgi:hypothetical protein